MVDNNTIYEVNPDASLFDRHELTRLIPLIVNFLKNNNGFDVAEQQAKFERDLRDFLKKKEDAQKRKLEEAKKAEATAESESYRLLFKHRRPHFDNEMRDWNDNIKTSEFETVSFKDAVLEKKDVFVSHLALTDPIEYMNQLDKALEKTEFLIRHKNGAFYESPRFMVKRIK
jgi:hypothetical protein